MTSIAADAGGMHNAQVRGVRDYLKRELTEYFQWNVSKADDFMKKLSNSTLVENFKLKAREIALRALQGDS